MCKLKVIDSIKLLGRKFKFRYTSSTFFNKYKIEFKY